MSILSPNPATILITREGCNGSISHDGSPRYKVASNLERLYRDYLEFSQLRSEAIATKELDLSLVQWFYPTLLLPLGLFIKQNQDINVTLPKHNDARNYFDIITKTGGLDGYKTYIPIIEIPRTRGGFDPLSRFSFSEIDCGSSDLFPYFINELVDNIYQHSDFSTAYIMVQKYPKMGFLELCILDNGISIPKSYEKVGISIKNDKVALDNALRGISTKNEDGRGFGLRSSVRLITLGMNGVCLIVSRRGALCASHDGRNFFNLDEKDINYGTLISINIPFQTTKVNLYDYVE
jgi:hypothetical protein